MEPILSQDELIDLLSKKARFSKGDTKIFLDSLIEIFEESVRESNIQPNEKGKVLIKIRGLGKLYLQGIPARKGKDRMDLPFTTRAIFRLAENIRNSNKVIIDTEADLDSFE